MCPSYHGQMFVYLNMHFIDVQLYIFILLFIAFVLKYVYMNIDLSKLEHRVASVSDAKQHFLAIQESYKEASKFLPEFVGWNIGQFLNMKIF